MKHNKKEWRDPVTGETWKQICARINKKTTKLQVKYFGHRITEPLR
jgi:hypothetical protein